MLAFVNTLILNAQQKTDSDTTKQRPNENIFNKAFRVLDKAPQTMLEADTLQEKDYIPYLSYMGKIIRNINYRQLGFEINFSDTTKRLTYFGTKLLNDLHTDTRTEVIRNNTFIKKGRPLNPYDLAYNERYLRTLEFIQDARILVKPIRNNPDSVDLEIITKDLFTINAGVNNLSTNRIRANISESNLMGLGQKVQFSFLMQSNRTPSFGYEITYQKNNLWGSFINARVGYSNINPSLFNFWRNERATFFKLERPLYAPTSKWVGSLEIGQYYTVPSFFDEPDSLHYNYKYKKIDGWIGYNLRVKKVTRNFKKASHLIGLRFTGNKFSEVPEQKQQPYDIFFDNKTTLLAQYVIFRQNYVKTNYIYAFGTTEDVPEGYNIATTFGWQKQSDLVRFYSGIDANLYRFLPSGCIMQHYVRTGGFLNKGHREDLEFLVGTSLFSRLQIRGRTKYRQYVNIIYTKQFKRNSLHPLYLDNDFGLLNFRTKSVFGHQRITVQSETSMFLHNKFIGFKFAPFLYAAGSLLTPDNEKLNKSNLYVGIGGGVRIRNENLIFRTVEMRATFFPRVVPGNNTFRAGIRMNLRMRFNTEYVKLPDMIQVNSDADNKIL